MIYYIANRLSDNPRERLLVIDDGAYFVRALSNLEIHEPGITGIFRNRTHIVEQTTRGHRYFKKPKYKDLVENSIKAPVVSIAKCKTKVKFESPFIGAAASRALVNRFEHENIDIRKFRRIAIIGFGPVGEAVFRALRPLFNRKMIVVDKDEHTHQKIVDLKGEPHASLPEDGGFDLVVGCTGYRSFKLSDWDRLSRNALLISTSSAAVEFNRKQFIDITELSENNEYKIVNKERVRKAGMHANIKIKDKKRDRSVTFINASFPVNFDGRMECLPADIIQATHTLLYAAGYQALQSHKPGFAKLDDEFDNQIWGPGPNIARFPVSSNIVRMLRRRGGIPGIYFKSSLTSGYGTAFHIHKNQAVSVHMTGPA
jgi:hypothetical protein